MQNSKRKTLLLAFISTILVFGAVLCRLLPTPALLNSSNELSARVIREYGGVFVYNDGYLRSKHTSHHIPQVLASNKQPEWKRVVECESNFNHYDKNGNILIGDQHLKYDVYGIAQFQKRTFYWLADISGKDNLSLWSKDDQIELLKWAIENGYGELWSCY